MNSLIGITVFLVIYHNVCVVEALIVRLRSEVRVTGKESEFRVDVNRYHTLMSSGWMSMQRHLQ